jgi:hypothetical protein
MTSTCTIKRCHAPAAADGLCAAHEEQWRRTASVWPALGRRGCDNCPYGGCQNRHAAHGLCLNCYRRWRKRQRLGLPVESIAQPLPHPTQKLSAADRDAIRAWYAREAANGLRMADIAEHYGVSKQRISQIIRDR